MGKKGEREPHVRSGKGERRGKGELIVAAREWMREAGIEKR